MIADMPRARLPYLRHEKNRHGEWVWYFRKDNGKRKRIRGEYGSKQFKAEYDAALRGEKTPKGKDSNGTLGWLIARYQESSRYLSLKESTRTTRDRVYKELLLSDARHSTAAKIRRKHMVEAMDKRASTPHAANNFLIYMRQMFDWAVAAEHVKENPCDGVRLIKAKTEGFHPWTVAEVEQFRAKHPLGGMPRLALEMLLFLGLRRSDVIHAGRQHVQNEVLSIQTTKTGAWVHIPIMPALREAIDATERKGLAFLVSATGMPFKSAGSFANWFKAQCVEAGLPHCSAHGLRKIGATLSADAGSSERELMAMYGWENTATASVYTKQADKKRLARSAAERIANEVPPHREQSAAKIAEK